MTETLANKILRKLCYEPSWLDVETERKIAELKKLDPIRIFSRKMDLTVENQGKQVPVRVFFASEQMEREAEEYRGKVILFFHGGGWVSESVETYERICCRMAVSTNCMVISVEYRRAPEYRFPAALEDCCAVYESFLRGEIIKHPNRQKLILTGDSAGGNLTAALTLMLRDRKKEMPAAQILIYPALWNDHSENAPFPSVRENGTGRLLTSAKVEEYMNLYQSRDEDRNNPLFAPLLEKDLTGLPPALILTAEHDLLRDEGEAYAGRLQEAGVRTELHRIQGASHGYFALGIGFIHVKESLEYISRFLKEETDGGETSET